MAVITMKQLLEAGVHFGHQAKRWNPKMGKYIFTERNGIHIIDLHKTLKKVESSYAAVKEIAENGGKVLFVGTKKQAQTAIKIEAERCGMYYITNRWLGGMLTNFNTIKKRVDRLKQLEKMEEDGTLDLLPKKEASLLRKEMVKLNKNLGGIKEMKGVPDVIFIVDVKKEALAITEALKLNIPIVAMIDTNTDPDGITFPIPSNDDAIRSVSLMASVISNAVIEGNEGEEALAAAKAARPVMENKPKKNFDRNKRNFNGTGTGVKKPYDRSKPRTNA